MEAVEEGELILYLWQNQPYSGNRTKSESLAGVPPDRTAKRWRKALPVGSLAGERSITTWEI